MEPLLDRQGFCTLIIFLRVEIRFRSQGSDQGPVKQSGVNDRGAETQRQTSQGERHRTTTKSEPFSLISTPTPAMLGAVDWMVASPQKDNFQHDTCEHNLIWKKGLGRCNKVNMRSHWSRVTLKPVRLMLL